MIDPTELPDKPPRRRASDPPRSMAASAALISIPIVSVLGGFGWLAEKILTLDERSVRLVSETASQESRLQEGYRKIDYMGLRQESLVVRVDDLSKAQSLLREQVRELTHAERDKKSQTQRQTDNKVGVNP